MRFNYHVLGKDSELTIYVKPRNMNKRKLWSVKGPQENEFWKTGQVSLGLVSEFRVIEVNEFIRTFESWNLFFLGFLLSKVIYIYF